jgi:predicted regulator of Ras-like GTPase activity (Roadblock/LC7/MglB family)
MTVQHPTADPGFLLERFVTDVPGVLAAQLASSDGLKKTSFGIEQDEADRLSAVLSGLVALADGYAHSTSRRTARTTFTDGYVGLGDMRLFTVSAGDGGVLGVLGTAEGDPGLIGHEMNDLVKKVAAHLGTPQRATGPAT